jgi:hypothetical protein
MLFWYQQIESNETPSTSKLSSDHLKFLNELDIESCLDFQTSSGEWEVYIVVGMSEFRSELEIKSLENGEK